MLRRRLLVLANRTPMEMKRRSRRMKRKRMNERRKHANTLNSTVAKTTNGNSTKP
jgi:hypothetical protein